MKIDWTHPLTNNLVFCGLVQARALVDLVSGTRLFPTTTDPTVEVSAGVGGEGICSITPETQVVGVSATSISPIYLPAGLSVLSVASVDQAHTSSSLLYELSDEVSPIFAGVSYYWESGNGRPLLQYNQTYGYSVVDYTNTYAVNTIANIVLTVDTDMKKDQYYNGELVAENDADHDNDSLGYAPPTLDQLTIIDNENANGPGYARLYMLAIYDIPLSSDISQSLTLDPYQFLIPDRG